MKNYNLLLFLVSFLISSSLFSQTNTANAAGLWSNTSTWSLGHVPTALETVVIPSGSTIRLVGSCIAKTVTINGILTNSSNTNFSLHAEWIMVHGAAARLQIGTSATPYLGTAVFTLVGNNDGQSVGGMGDKFMGAMMGGRIDMHGQDKKSWTKLDGNVVAGTNQIKVVDANNWAVNDEIVVVSSRTNWNEAEKRSITAIAADGKTLTLNASLQYPHVGVVKSYTRSTDNKTWTADIRAEVGMLSHNIKIQGDVASATSYFGGHIMLHTNAYAYFSGVELYRMGQKSLIGRYPFHWHLLKEVGNGQYFKNSSVHLSYNRAITIHGTESTLVDNNFFYDHIGHGVFLEDGTERFNTISNNVTLLTKRPAPGEEVTPSDNQFNELQNRTPSSYWITNPNNTFLNNIAAGTQGTGFWFALPASPMGDSANDPRFNGIQPNRENLGLFKGNVVHSSMNGFDIFDGLSLDHAILRNRSWFNSNPHVMEDCLWYANDLAIYSGFDSSALNYNRNLIFRNNIFLENSQGMMLASFSVIDQSLFVAYSGENLNRGRIHAYRLYDGAGTVQNSHFVGFNAPRTNLLINTGAATKHSNHRFRGITTDHTGFMNIGLDNFNVPQTPDNTGANSIGHPRFWASVIRDEDGSLSGVAGNSIVGNHPLQITGGEFQASNWTNIVRSPNKFGHLQIFSTGLGNTTKAGITRIKSGTPTASTFYIPEGGFEEAQSFPVIVNNNFEYTIDYQSLIFDPVGYNPLAKLIIVFEDAEPGDVVQMRLKNFGSFFKRYSRFTGNIFNPFETVEESTITFDSADIPLIRFNSYSDYLNSNESGYFTQVRGDTVLRLKASRHTSASSVSLTPHGNIVVLPPDIFLSLSLAYPTRTRANYYLSQSGNDNNNGTSPSSPWKTVSKLSSIIPMMVNGDVIHLRRGDNFLGILNGILPTNINDVKIRVYGSGSNNASINN
jgi:hypothetical protein